MHPSVLLIFGTSHVGKSTLAAGMGTALGWKVLSTDQLARHPGRPWPEVKPAVADFYESLSDESIYWFLQVHHENLWPRIQHLIAAESASRQGLVFEGSALRPEFIANLESQAFVPVGLHASADFLLRRIKTESRYNELDGRMRSLVDKFITRSLHDNQNIVSAAERLGLRLVNIEDRDKLDELPNDLKELLSR